jgi:hypothetical protein
MRELQPAIPAVPYCHSLGRNFPFLTTARRETQVGEPLRPANPLLFARGPKIYKSPHPLAMEIRVHADT